MRYSIRAFKVPSKTQNVSKYQYYIVRTLLIKTGPPFVTCQTK